MLKKIFVFFPDGNFAKIIFYLILIFILIILILRNFDFTIKKNNFIKDNAKKIEQDSDGDGLKD
jgi:preprotein translocase subunit SecG